MAPPRNERVFEPNASIVLVGCRGAGKRTLGFMGALHLRRRLVTEDHYFEKLTGLTRGQYLAAHGKENFTRQNMDVFKRMLDTNRTGCVIECGMSSLTTAGQEALREYSKTHPVVYIHREKEQILRLMDSGDARQLLETDGTHRTCSNLEYYNIYDYSTTASPSGSTSGPSTPVNIQQPGPSKLLCAQEDFARFLDIITGRGVTKAWLESPFSVAAIPPEFRSYSYTLRLRISYLMDMDLEWEDFEAKGDCVELIIDHWPADLYNVIARQVSLIRRKLGVPIIYHVEENPRGERRRTPAEKNAMDTELLDLGLRLGVDYISVDLQRDSALVNRVLQHRGRTKIIGNYWYMGFRALAWQDDQQLTNYLHAQSLGCDVIRMVRFCTNDSPAEYLTSFKSRLHATIPDPKPPLVAYDFSVLGVRTPLQTTILGPVKLPDIENDRDHLATVSSYPHSFELLFRQFLLDPLHFYVLGSRVSYSLSPAMHAAAYDASGMPHSFQSVTCSTLDALTQICASDAFGGACLTAPFKVAVLPRLKVRSHHAAAIGAVNVLLPLRGRTGAVLDHANSRNKGATVGNAEAVARHFNEWAASQGGVVVNGGSGSPRWNGGGGAGSPGLSSSREFCRVLPSLAEPWPAGYQLPTMVVSCVPANNVDGNPPADFVMPLDWLGSPTGGVIVELAYEPLVTPLVAQMHAVRDTMCPSWVVVDGLEVVAEMAIEAFELMTGRMAPKRLMKEVCRKTWEGQQQQQRALSSEER
ncbi:hypothetical protein N0V88_003099 [Collariella sp. IMI 366227]|nr:hypothetical protein N0V88_003099 [Collariella sp. IMI 366227]